jgi:hypothetical protein
MLNFDNRDFKRKGRKISPKPLLGVGALVGAIILGPTLAANINLNSGASVEFGQGVAQATACDSSIIVTPFSNFVNDEESADFTFTSFSVSDISEACFGKLFTIRAYKNSQDSPLNLYTTSGISNPFNEIQVLDNQGSFSLIDSGLQIGGISNSPTSFTVNLSTSESPASTAVASAQDVDRISIESRDAVGLIPTQFEVGDIDPGRGEIFYVSDTGFNCGSEFTNTGSPSGGLCHYLEVALTGRSPNWSDLGFAWSGNTNTLIGTTSTAIGSGYMNTLAMLAQDGTSQRAGSAAQAYRGGGLSDWYLPSKDELNEIFLNRSTISGLVCVDYWSSSEENASQAWFHYFHFGVQEGKNKNSANYCARPIRAF